MTLWKVVIAVVVLLVECGKGVKGFPPGGMCIGANSGYKGFCIDSSDVSQISQCTSGDFNNEGDKTGVCGENVFIRVGSG